MTGEAPVRYVRIAEGEPLPDLAPFAPYLAVVVLEAAYSPEWQQEVSASLVGSGCLYMMAWGPDCSSWDDSVDYANIDRFPGGDIPPEAFVMTTWHEEEPLEEVFWFAGNGARPYGESVQLAHMVIVHVSQADAAADMLARFAAAQALL